MKKANGTVKIDSNSFGGLFAEALLIQPKVGTFSKSYPNQANRILKVLGNASWVVSYPGGIPTVNIDTNTLTVATMFYFFVL